MTEAQRLAAERQLQEQCDVISRVQLAEEEERQKKRAAEIAEWHANNPQPDDDWPDTPEYPVVQCDHCISVTDRCNLACDPYFEELHAIETTPTYWCWDCYRERAQET